MHPCTSASEMPELLTCPHLPPPSHRCNRRQAKMNRQRSLSGANVAPPLRSGTMSAAKTAAAAKPGDGDDDDEDDPLGLGRQQPLPPALGPGAPTAAELTMLSQQQQVGGSTHHTSQVTFHTPPQMSAPTQLLCRASRSRWVVCMTHPYRMQEYVGLGVGWDHSAPAWVHGLLPEAKAVAHTHMPKQRTCIAHACMPKQCTWHRCVDPRLGRLSPAAHQSFAARHSLTWHSRAPRTPSDRRKFADCTRT